MCRWPSTQQRWQRPAAPPQQPPPPPTHTHAHPCLQDFTLVATGTTFPLVFTIQQAFMRRERATTLLANLKASVVALYLSERGNASLLRAVQSTLQPSTKVVSFTFPIKGWERQLQETDVSQKVHIYLYNAPGRS